MKAKISFLTIMVASLVGCSNAEQTESARQQGWNNFGSFNFEASTDGVVVQKYEIHKAYVGQVMSVTAPDSELHIIETQQGALFKGVGQSGLLSHDECMDLIGELGTAAKVSPSIVRFFLEKGSPLGPDSLSAEQDFSVSESINSAEIAVGNSTIIEIEGESYPIGPMVELTAPWGASGQIMSADSVEFSFQYYTTVEGQKETVDIQGGWSQEMGAMHKFNQEPASEWLACVTPEVKAILEEQEPNLVGEMLDTMTQAELANNAI